MKTLAVLFLAFVASVSCQDDGAECHCGMFMTYQGSEVQVHSLSPFDIDFCYAVELCKSMCAYEYRRFTNNGDLNHILPSGYSVGQVMCIELKQKGIDSVSYETIHGYARLCDGPWDYDGESSINDLCCNNGYYIPCD